MMPASLLGRRAAALHAERTPNLQLCVRDACGRVVSLCTATARAVDLRAIGRRSRSRKRGPSRVKRSHQNERNL